jgi:hypothetical protein
MHLAKLTKRISPSHAFDAYIHLQQKLSSKIYDIDYYIELWSSICHRFMLKWFYDTFTGAAIGATRCSSFVGEDFGLLVVSYG